MVVRAGYGKLRYVGVEGLPESQTKRRSGGINRGALINKLAISVDCDRFWCDGSIVFWLPFNDGIWDARPSCVDMVAWGGRKSKYDCLLSIVASK